MWQPHYTMHPYLWSLFNNYKFITIIGDIMADNEEITEGGDKYTEIKMGAGWFLTVTLTSSERYENEYVEIAKERSGQKKSRFNLNPKYVRALGETLIQFADENKLE